jgi:hypothetical protein
MKKFKFRVTYFADPEASGEDFDGMLETGAAPYIATIEIEAENETGALQRLGHLLQDNRCRNQYEVEEE